MSVEIKQLTMLEPVFDDQAEATDDTFNLIPEANKVYTLYTAPANKAVIVKSVRVTNILSQTVQINLYLNRPANNLPRRRLLAPKNLPIPQQSTYIDDAEITLEPGDSIQALCLQNNGVHYVISGVEREVT
jgi:hypothetical protein